MFFTKINELETKIKALDDISGFKKSITEHNKIYKELEQCKTEVENIDKYVDDLYHHIDNENNENNKDISDEEYMQYIAEIGSLNEGFDIFEVDQQIQAYQDSLMKIKLCDNYLKSRKMEICYLETNK